VDFTAQSHFPRRSPLRVKVIVDLTASGLLVGRSFLGLLPAAEAVRGVLVRLDVRHDLHEGHRIDHVVVHRGRQAPIAVHEVVIGSGHVRYGDVRGELLCRRDLAKARDRQRLLSRGLAFGGALGRGGGGQVHLGGHGLHLGEVPREGRARRGARAVVAGGRRGRGPPGRRYGQVLLLDGHVLAVGGLQQDLGAAPAGPSPALGRLRGRGHLGRGADLVRQVVAVLDDVRAQRFPVGKARVAQHARQRRVAYGRRGVHPTDVLAKNHLNTNTLSPHFLSHADR